MKKIFGWVALLMGMVTGANAQVNDTIQRVTGNDLYPVSYTHLTLPTNSLV